MKIILSHDVDHINVSEHLFKDLIIPKFIIRSCLELSKDKISISEFGLRIRDLLKNKWNNVSEIIELHNSYGIKSNFFVGVNNGLGLSYNKQASENIIKFIIGKNFEVGVHGIAFENFENIKIEFEDFKRLSNQDVFGIRMHYLRTNNTTFENLEKAGYSFDCSDVGMKNPYKIKEMWEFPVQIMDGWVINGNEKMQSRNLKQAQEYTIEQIELAHKNKLNYLSILFHDHYFKKSFRTWMDWYIWLLEFLKLNKFEIITYSEAIKELNENQNN